MHILKTLKSHFLTGILRREMNLQTSLRLFHMYSYFYIDGMNTLHHMELQLYLEDKVSVLVAYFLHA